MSSEARDLIFQRPKNLFERAELAAATAVAYPVLYRCPQFLIQRTQYQQVIDIVEGFFRDLGGEAVTIPTLHGHTLQGFYLNAASYHEKQESAFAKWKPEFLNSDFLVNYLGLNREATSLPAFFSLPPLEKSTKIKAGLICNGANNLYQCNPQLAISLLAKNVSTLMFNYGGIYNSIGPNPNGLTTNQDGEAAYYYLRDRVQCTDEESFIHGISLGSSVATYVATQYKVKKVLLDRYFCRMSAMLGPVTPYLMGSVQKFYPFPTQDLLKFVSGDVLLMRAENDEMMTYYHTEVLEAALRDANKPVRSITVPGEHSGPSWYSDPATHAEIHNFMES